MSMTWDDSIRWPETDTDRKAWELAKAELAPEGTPITDALFRFLVVRATEIKAELKRGL